jgi:uncharacterized GH25 family protein
MRFLGSLLLLCVAAQAAAHDFWIQPPSGKTLTIRLMQGEHFHGEPVARDEARIERFVIRDGRGDRTIKGATGDEPAGRIEAGPGLSIVGYRTHPRRHGSMAAERFESYLREEGLEHVIELRAKRGHAKKRATEIFSRSAKSLVRQPGETATRFDERLGLRFEIVPITSPWDGSTLAVQLLFDGKPLAGTLVTAMHAKDRSLAANARSNAEGRVTLPVARSGAWLIKAVHMLDAPEGSGAEWESVWATLTFERTGAN